MIYKKITIDFGCRDYHKIISSIDNAINILMDALSTRILDNGTTGYKLNTGQSNVEVTLSSEADITNQIMRLEKLRELYVVRANKHRTGNIIRLRDQSNFI